MVWKFRRSQQDVRSSSEEIMGENKVFISHVGVSYFN